MEKGAPRELNKAIVTAMAPVALVAAARTPRDTGRLQASNRVASRGARVVLRNTQPYAMAIHWGRRQVQGVPSVIKGRPWMWDTLQEQRDEAGRTVIREIDRFITRKAP